MAGPTGGSLKERLVLATKSAKNTKVGLPINRDKRALGVKAG